MGLRLGERGGIFATYDCSALGHGGEPLPELVIGVPNEVRRPEAVWCGLAQLLGGPSVGGTAGHVEMDDFARVVGH